MDDASKKLTAEELKRQRNREASARYRERNREKFNERMRTWRENNRDKAREQSREWRNRKIANGTPEEVAALRKTEAERTRRAQAACKDEVYRAYGGYRCACCGETEPMFLSIDHIDNNGAEERRSGLYAATSTSFYRWLRKSGFPSGYQVLCMNCQVGKHKNGGICPHQTCLNTKGT